MWHRRWIVGTQKVEVEVATRGVSPEPLDGLFLKAAVRVEETHAVSRNVVAVEVLRERLPGFYEVQVLAGRVERGVIRAAFFGQRHLRDVASVGVHLEDDALVAGVCDERYPGPIRGDREVDNVAPAGDLSRPVAVHVDGVDVLAADVGEPLALDLRQHYLGGLDR